MKNEHKVLILGGSGYIGTTLCPYLAACGYDVTVIDLCWFGNELPADIAFKQMDIFDLKAKDLEEFQTVIFLAGLSNDPMAEFSPKDNFIYNTGMPAYIGFIAKEAGIRKMIFASSCSVYGYTHNRTFSEDDVAISNYPYGVSKLQGEKALLALADEAFTVICFRQGTVSGYSPRMRLDLAINAMFKNAYSKSEITLSNAKIWRPILGLRDLNKAYELAIGSTLTDGHIINLSSFNTTIGDLSKAVEQFMSETYGLNVAISDQHIQDYRNYKVSIDKAQELLNYQPVQDERSILMELSHHLDRFKDFDNDKYYNIAVFKKLMNSNAFAQ